MLTFFFLVCCLVIEKQSINWLKNRNGCNHFNLQKYIELDLRVRAFKENWLNQRIEYDVDNYKKHYFHGDFDTIK